MVSISPILRAIPYVQGKTDDEISVAVAAAGLPDPEKVKIVTGFINNLINLEISKLEKAAGGDSSDAKAQHEAQQSRIKYHTNSPVALVNEVADTLTKNIFIVQELVGRDCQGYKDFDQTFAEGLNNIEQSTEVLLHSAIDIVNSKLSGYSMKIDTNNLQQSAKALVQELRNPPKPKSQTTMNGEADSLTETAAKTGTSTTGTPPAAGTVNTTTKTTTSSETPANYEKISTAFTKFITEISNLASVRTLLKQDHGLETLSKLNKDLADLNPIIKDKNALPAALENAFKALNDEAHSENKTFINNYVANPEKFTEEFGKLDDNQKLQIQMTLINIEGQAKQTKTINNIASSITEIKKGLGGDRLGTLLNELNSVNESLTSSSQENHLESIDNLLNEFNQNLKTANQAETGEEKIEERNKATKAFIEKLKTGLKNGSLSNADIELIEERLDPSKKETAEQSQKAITERVLKNLNLSEEQLKGFAGIAVAAVVGLMVFCPNAIGNLFKAGTGLATMAAQTLPMFFQAQAMMQMSQKGNTETASSQAA